MRYRQLDQNYDMQFGYGQAEFLVNSPAAVAQLVLTRLRLYLGEWFLNTTDGTAWRTGVLGNNTASTRDPIIQARILSTPGVNSILSYSSSFNSSTRQFSIAVGLDTIYGVYPSNTPIATTTGTASGPSSSPPVITNNVVYFILDSPTQGILDAIQLG